MAARKARRANGEGDRIPPPMTVFVSHKSEDKRRLEGFVTILKALKHEVFIAPDSLVPGERWRATLKRKLADFDVVLVFWTKGASDSDEVTWEYELALKNGKRVIPVMGDTTPLKKPLSGIHGVPFDPRFYALLEIIRKGGKSKAATRRLILERLEEYDIHLDDEERKKVFHLVGLLGFPGYLGWIGKLLSRTVELTAGKAAAAAVVVGGLSAGATYAATEAASKSPAVVEVPALEATVDGADLRSGDTLHVTSAGGDRQLSITARTSAGAVTRRLNLRPDPPSGGDTPRYHEPEVTVRVDATKSYVDPADLPDIAPGTSTLYIHATANGQTTTREVSLPAGRKTATITVTEVSSGALPGSDVQEFTAPVSLRVATDLGGAKTLRIAAPESDEQTLEVPTIEVLDASGKWVGIDDSPEVAASQTQLQVRASANGKKTGQKTVALPAGPETPTITVTEELSGASSGPDVQEFTAPVSLRVATDLGGAKTLRIAAPESDEQTLEVPTIEVLDASGKWVGIDDSPEVAASQTQLQVRANANGKKTGKKTVALPALKAPSIEVETIPQTEWKKAGKPDERHRAPVFLRVTAKNHDEESAKTVLVSAPVTEQVSPTVELFSIVTSKKKGEERSKLFPDAKGHSRLVVTEAPTKLEVRISGVTEKPIVRTVALEAQPPEVDSPPLQAPSIEVVEFTDVRRQTTTPVPTAAGNARLDKRMTPWAVLPQRSTFLQITASVGPAGKTVTTTRRLHVRPVAAPTIEVTKASYDPRRREVKVEGRTSRKAKTLHLGGVDVTSWLHRSQRVFTFSGSTQSLGGARWLTMIDQQGLQGRLQVVPLVVPSATGSTGGGRDPAASFLLKNASMRRAVTVVYGDANLKKTLQPQESRKISLKKLVGARIEVSAP